jgi:hypothetical protein
MAGTIAILTRAPIQREEFLQLLRELGAFLNPDGVFDGTLVQDDGQIWVVLTKVEQDITEPETLEAIREKLGSEPRGNIIVEIGNDPGSRRLAVFFARVIAGRWPGVVADLVDTVYSSEEVEMLWQSGGDFFEIGPIKP